MRARILDRRLEILRQASRAIDPALSASFQGVPYLPKLLQTQGIKGREAGQAISGQALSTEVDVSLSANRTKMGEAVIRIKRRLVAQVFLKMQYHWIGMMIVAILCCGFVARSYSHNYILRNSLFRKCRCCRHKSAEFSPPCHTEAIGESDIFVRQFGVRDN